MEAAGHRHVILVRVMLALATVLAVAAIFAVWANRQVLNAHNWGETSAEVLAQPAVKSQVADFLVDQVYANVDVPAELRRALPPRLEPLAGPAAGGLRELSTRTTVKLLGRPRVEQAWQAANEVTAQQFINIAEGRSSAITASGNAVILDLRVLVGDLVQRLGLPGRLAGKLPPTAGRVKILESDQVRSVQRGADLLHGLAVVLPILSLGLFAAAVGLARGRRRTVLLWVGIDLLAAGVVVLIARNLLGSYVVDQLAGQGPVRPAAEAAWSVGTGMLRDTAQAAMIGAVPLLLAAWVAGPSRPAIAVRHRLAPVLREHPGPSYAVLGAVLLLVVAWGPIPATRKVIPVLIMAALAALGLEVLRRQTREEFPLLAASPTPLSASPASSPGADETPTAPGPPVAPAG